MMGFEELTVGRRGSRQRVVERAAEPISSETMVHYEHRLDRDGGTLTESYDNRPDGLEQRFALSERPEGHGLLVVSVDVAGLRVLAESLDAVSLVDTRSGVPVLRYATLAAWDGTGRALTAHMETHQNTIQLVVDDSDAVYPVMIDPVLSRAGWSPEGEDAGAELGAAVRAAGDINGDGFGDVVLSAPKADGGVGVDTGKVYVYLGSRWGLSTTVAWSAEGT